MVDAIYTDNGRIQVINDDDISFDTQRPSFPLFPESSVLAVNNFIIDFPSIIQARAYYRTQGGAGGAQTSCELWSTMIWQEWGPQYSTHNEIFYPDNPGNSIPGPTTRNLSSLTIGTIPSQANYFDIRVRLRRTITPAVIYGIEAPRMFFPEDEWITLPGGSCPTETGGNMMRHFDIVRSGNSMIINRYQSVRNSGTNRTTSAPGGNEQRNIRTNESGWNSSAQIVYGPGTYSDGTSNANLSPRSNDQLASLITRKGPDSSGDKRPGGSNSCEGNYPNLAARYSVDIRITPGIDKT